MSSAAAQRSGAADGSVRVAVLTRVDFWRSGAGHRARIAALLDSLLGIGEVTLVWLSHFEPEDLAQIRTRWPHLRLHALELPQQGERSGALAALAAFFAAHPQHACIVEYLELFWLRPAVPRGVLCLVDTHDVVSERDRTLVEAGVSIGRSVISPAQEAERLGVFDVVMAISPADAATFARWVVPGRVLLVPHAQPASATPLPAGQNVLFVGSAYAPNLIGLGWFLREVWPRLDAAGAELHVVGDAGPALELSSGPRLHVHGRLADLGPAYRQARVCINPVSMGSGLKIKTVEALAHARPLVTTTHGARGLENAAGRAFVVADTPDAFAQAIAALLSDDERAATLAAAAGAWAERTLSPASSHGPLLRLVRQWAARGSEPK